MAERIYILDGDNLQPMEEQRFALEDDLQKLLAEHPHLLDGEQVSPGNPRRWLLIKREMGVPAAASEAAQFSLDHLLVDQDAIPTLVEVKRGSNTQIRREVVGQMLDYAANASQFWTLEDLRRSFEETWKDAADEQLRELLQPEDEVPDADAFWGAVATNLAAKRMRLLFVADAIPIELARIVEFLNAQFRDNIEALAVEVKQFRGESAGLRSALVPNVIGHTAAAPGKSAAGARIRRNLTRESFLAECAESDNPNLRNAAECLISAAEESGAILRWRKEAVSIRGTCPLWREGRNPVSIAWLYRPSDLSWGSWLFGTEIFSGYEEEPNPNLKGFIEEYAAKFAADAHAEYKPWKVNPRWLFKREHITLEQANVWAERVADALKGLRELKA